MRGSVTTSFYHHPAPLPLRCGGELPDFTLAYETYGQLNEDKSNAILLFHALSGSHHAAGFNPEVPGTDGRWTEECHHGWWSAFIGPGRALDTSRWFVICVNFIGGCYGSTGPCSIHPSTGKPWGAAFPQVSANDIVRSQLHLLDHLGIRTLHAVMGASVGGLCAIHLATTFPDRVKLVFPIATGGSTTVLNRLFILEQILAIENDADFKGGDYYESEPPVYGLALARMISHKTFVHLDEIEKRARGDVRQPATGLSWYRVQDNVESYMLHQGKKFVRRFDANTYLRICGMWSGFDPVKEGEADSWNDLLRRSQRAGHHYLVFSIDSDFCFYPEEQAALVHHLEEAGVSVMHITVHSHKGHDSFLLEPMLYTPHLSYALASAGPEPETGPDPGM